MKKPTKVTKFPDGSIHSKFTLSYELLVEVELFEEEKCDGCVFFHSSGYSNKCLALQKALPTRAGLGHEIYTGRHPECPLKKVDER